MSYQHNVENPIVGIIFDENPNSDVNFKLRSCENF